MAVANYAAGILESLGKVLSGVGMGQIEQKNKLELQEKANEPYMNMLSGMNPDDMKALMWARQNPNDPRAKAILQKLGR